MAHRRIRLKPNKRIKPCPKCGNNTRFTLNAEQCAVDCCEIFVVCQCGYEPTNEIGDRYEDVWGYMDTNAAMVALDCWNYTLATEVN